MPYTFKTSTAAGSGGNANQTTSVPIDTTGANLLIVLVGSLPAAGTPVISDSQLNTWELLGQQTGDVLISCYMAKNAIVALEHTFQSTLTGGLMGMVVMAFAGGNSIDPFLNEFLNTNGNAASFDYTVTLLPSHQNSLAIVAVAIANLSTVSSISDDFVGTQTPLVPTENYGCCGAYKILTFPYPLNPTITFTDSTGYSARLEILIPEELSILMGDGLT